MRKTILLILLLLLLMPAAAANESNPMDAWHTYNRTDAFSSINGMSDNFTWEYNVSDYTYIENMSSLNPDEDIPTQIISISTTPFKWWADGPLGSWWYVIVIIGILLITYVMSKQLSAVSVVSLMLSSLALGSHESGVIYMAPEAVKTLYLIVIGSLVAVLYYGLSQR